MLAKISATFALAALASAQAAVPGAEPGVPAGMRKVAPAADHDKAYLTVTAPNIVQPAPVIAATPASVVQNAASAEPTVTETVTNGASSALGSLGMSVAALAGSVFAASYF
ncbi:hypothetical protein H4S08_001080 [Coemansia sp. RSA 1365]|nr:hypothetical protein H4S08_001080 [Coemansia sp. RSA 1365]